MSTVSTEVRGRTLIVTIERPAARNAVDGPTAQALYDAFKAFDADAGLDVAILQGRDTGFCAGADLKGVAEGRGTAWSARATSARWASPDFASASR